MLRGLDSIGWVLLISEPWLQHGCILVLSKFLRSWISKMRSWLVWVAVVTPTGVSRNASFKAFLWLHWSIIVGIVSGKFLCSVLYKMQIAVSMPRSATL